MSLLLTIPGTPMQKPTIRSRAWKTWRRWADGVRLVAMSQGWRPADPEPLVMFTASYFAIPQSWTLRAKETARGVEMRSKPDANHLWNAVADALYERDERIALGLALKLWDDGGGPRTVIYLGDCWPIEFPGMPPRAAVVPTLHT